MPLQACPEWLAVINLFRLVFELFCEFFATRLSRVCVEQLIPLFLLPQRLPLPHLQQHEHSVQISNSTVCQTCSPQQNHSIVCQTSTSQQNHSKEGQTTPYGSATMQSATICTQTTLALSGQGARTSTICIGWLRCSDSQQAALCSDLGCPNSSRLKCRPQCNWLQIANSLAAVQLALHGCLPSRALVIASSAVRGLHATHLPVLSIGMSHGSHDGVHQGPGHIQQPEVVGLREAVGKSHSLSSAPVHPPDALRYPNI